MYYKDIVPFKAITYGHNFYISIILNMFFD
ncbi:MAG: hypothetical protein A4E49_02343 [Methanosaeta sp. PtaU1.Bin112]|nr:MAG: hypothetical protein A4E49_02343 [Methanosaeta sp. PtaU1.Bin112]